MSVRFLDYMTDTRNTGKLKILLAVILVIVVVADFLVHREHAAFIWDKIPGWSAFFGFASCVFLIVVAKFIGHAWLMKKEDYYD